MTQDRPADEATEHARRVQALAFARPQPSLPVILVAGETITLRPPRLDEVDAIVDACRDPQAVAWTTVPDPYAVSDAVSYVTEFAPQRWARSAGAIFAIADAADCYAGSIALDLLSPTTGDVGFMVAPTARGRGYASSALRAMCDWAYQDLGLHRIEWRAYVGNVASRAVARKAGFTLEGLTRAGCVQRGRYRDAWTGARLATDG